MNLNDYLEMIWSLYPSGLAWVRENGALDKLNTVIAAELLKIDGRIKALMNEADPRTTSEMIIDWERVWGLPDECTLLGSTIQERRAAIISKMIMAGGMSPAFYQALIREMGYDADNLIEWKPLVIGERLTTGTMTDPDPLTRFCWGWAVYGLNANMFECGISECLDPLGDWSEGEELLCRMNKLKPAHTKVIFNFMEARP